MQQHFSNWDSFYFVITSYLCVWLLSLHKMPLFPHMSTPPIRFKVWLFLGVNSPFPGFNKYNYCMSILAVEICLKSVYFIITNTYTLYMYIVELTFMSGPNKHKNIRLRHHVCNRNLENWKTYCFEVHAGVRQGIWCQIFFHYGGILDRIMRNKKNVLRGVYSVLDTFYYNSKVAVVISLIHNLVYET